MWWSSSNCSSVAHGPSSAGRGMAKRLVGHDARTGRECRRHGLTDPLWCWSLVPQADTQLVMIRRTGHTLYFGPNPRIGWRSHRVEIFAAVGSCAGQCCLIAGNPPKHSLIPNAVGRRYDQRASHRPRFPNARSHAGKPSSLGRRTARLKDQRTPTDVHKSSAPPARPPRRRPHRKAPLLPFSLLLRSPLHQYFVVDGTLSNRWHAMQCESAATVLDVQHPQPGPLNGPRRRQASAQNLRAVHDRAATEQPVRIVVPVIQARLGCGISASIAYSRPRIGCSGQR